MFRRLALIAIVAVGFASFSVAEADSGRHLRLVKSEPGRSDTVSAPAALRLWFSLKPQLAITTLRLIGPGDSVVALSKVSFSGNVKDPVEAKINAPLQSGSYKVVWRTASSDMHPMTGDYSFVVR
ncbi:MAG: copper resistance CopC family protein [Gemmatimonadota bacterium]